VTRLEGNYRRTKLFQLIQHGNGITPRIHIQRDQWLSDTRLVLGIVDLLASTEKPAEIVGEVSIFLSTDWIVWPQNEKLMLKKKMTLPTASGLHVAEYELINKDCHFLVCIYYWNEDCFNKRAVKFIYRRLENCR
jgi:hypothetical protein